MSATDLTEFAEPISARILALEALIYAVADTCPDRAALRSAFDVYAAGTEAKMNALPVGDRYLELLRDSLDDMRVVIEQKRDS
jgi:hypothetical protein